MKIDPTFAFWGLGGERLSKWEGIKRIDNKPAKIIPYVIGYLFNKNGLTVVFRPSRYKLKYAKESNEIFYNFLKRYSEYVQTIQAISKMYPSIHLFKEEEIIKPFKDVIKNYKEQNFYDLKFTRTIKCPLNYNDINALIISFVVFFPIYYSMIEIAQNKKCSFRKIISMLDYEKLNNYYLDIEKYNIQESENNKSINMNINEVKYIKAGMRWQIFERDDFRCVACGKSAHDGAILHIDHIIPKSKGGRNAIDNYQTLCHLCNIGKSNKSDRNFRK